MHPKLVDLGPVPIYTYGVLLVVAFLAGLQVALFRARRRGLDSARVMDLGIYIIVSALVGAKLLLLVVDVHHYAANPGDILTLARSGGIFYGGLLLAVPVGVWYVRRHHLPVWTVGDVVAPAVAVGYAVGRVGCLMAGCCYGRPTELPWGIQFTDPLAAATAGTPLGVALHPTQAYDALSGTIIFVLLLAIDRRGSFFAGRTFWSFILLYAMARFGTEFFRGDPRGAVGDILSTSQFLSLAFLPLSLVMLLRLARRTPERADKGPLKRARAG